MVTRMTTHCDGKFNLERGIALARAAYEKPAGKPPPPIVAAPRPRVLKGREFKGAGGV